MTDKRREELQRRIRQAVKESKNLGVGPLSAAHPRSRESLVRSYKGELHDIHYLRRYRELAVKDDNLHMPFRCSCGDVYIERLVPNYTKGHSGPEVLFWCIQDNYATPVGLKDINKAKKVIMDLDSKEEQNMLHDGNEGLFDN